MLNPLQMFTALVDPRVWADVGQQVWKAMPWLVPTYGVIYWAMAPLVAGATHPKIGVIHTLLALDYTLIVFAIARLRGGAKGKNTI